MEAAESIKVVLVERGIKRVLWDVVPSVKFFDLFVNSNRLTELRTMPFSLRELAVGFLLSNAYIDDPHYVEDVRVGDERIDVAVDSEFDVQYEYLQKEGVEPIELVKIDKMGSNYTVSEETIKYKLRLVGEKATLHEGMNGIGFTALSDDNGLLFVSEDFYQESSFYKVAGKASLSGFDFRRSFLICSWPVCAETVVKAAVLGIPIVVSLSGVSKLAVRVAEKVTGQTVAVHDAGGSTKIYTFPQRII